MKLQARLHRGSNISDFEIELAPAEPSQGVRKFRIGGQLVEAHCEEIAPAVYSLLIEGRPCEAFVTSLPGEYGAHSNSWSVVVGLRKYQVELRDPRQWQRTGSSIESKGPQEITAPMPGRIVKVLVTEGQQVDRGQGMLVIEAMKMQNELRAPRAGRVERVYLNEGRGVESGARLVRLV